MGKKKNSLVIQAGLLAGASIISRIIGMLYRSPLKSVITAEGNGYYSTAYSIYLIILLLSSYNIPMGVSKMIAEEFALGRYKNANRIFRCSLLYVVVIGGIAAVGTFALAPLLVHDNPNAALALRVLAPTIFFSGILGAFRGYSQASGSMAQTSVSQVIEQIFNAIVSISAAVVLTRGITGTARAVKGAAGGAAGTLAGVIVGLVFMIFVFSATRRSKIADIANDRNTPDPYKVIFKRILIIVTPIIFTAFISNISTTANMLVYFRLMAMKAPEYDANTVYGVFSGEYIVLINVPIAIASAIGTSVVPGIATSYAKNNREETIEKTREAVSLAMIVGIPAAIGLASLAYPIIGTLFPQPETIGLSTSFLVMGTAVPIFNSFSTIIISVLQAMGKVNLPVKNAAITLAVDIAVLAALLWFTNLGIYALLVTMIVQSFVLCLTNLISLKKSLGYKQELKTTFIIPLISALIMGAAAFACTKLIGFITDSCFISLCVSGITAVAVYFVTVIKLGGISEEAMLEMPKGALLVKAAKKLRIL